MYQKVDYCTLRTLACFHNVQYETVHKTTGKRAPVSTQS